MGLLWSHPLILLVCFCTSPMLTLPYSSVLISPTLPFGFRILLAILGLWAAFVLTALSLFLFVNVLDEVFIKGILTYCWHIPNNGWCLGHPTGRISARPWPHPAAVNMKGIDIQHLSPSRRKRLCHRLSRPSHTLHRGPPVTPGLSLSSTFLLISWLSVVASC